MENPTNSFRETKLLLQLIWESQNKTVISWSSQKQKEGVSLLFILFEGNFLKICILSQCIVCWIHLQNIHTFTYQKALLHTILLLVSKIIKKLQCILNFFFYLFTVQFVSEILSRSSNNHRANTWIFLWDM